MATKECIRCGLVQEAELFPVHHDKGIIRHRNICRDCYNKARRKNTGDPAEYIPEVKDMVTTYLNLIQWQPDKLYTVTRERYNRQFNMNLTKREFYNIEDTARQRLETFGYFNPQELELDAQGKYLIISDTFGTHTPTEVFDLLRVVVSREQCNAVVVLGHNLDDENIISNKIGDFGVPVYLIAMKDELKDLHSQRGYGYQIFQDHIKIGSIIIRNQEHITPYMKMALESLDPVLFPGRMIVNCTRQELSVRPSPDIKKHRFIASPGCLSEPHVVTTINRLIFNSGEHISTKPTNKDSYHKHRKNETDKQLWECGYILLDNGECIQRRIHTFTEDNKLCATTVADGGVVNNKGEALKHQTTMVLSDLHLPSCDTDYLNQCFDNNSNVDRIIFNGDIFDCRAFNPHNPFEAATVDLKEDLYRCNKALKRALHKIKPGTKVEFLFGNHEDFVRRFTRQYPQFASFFKKAFTDILNKYGEIWSDDHQQWYQLSSDTIIHHGSADIYGARGNNLEKTARTFGGQAVIGHTHSPAIRFGVYRTGCMCWLNQGYNNAAMSNWAHGMALIYSTDEFDFIELRNRI